MKQWPFILSGIFAGSLLPVQAGLNAMLGQSVKHPIFAAFASFVVGTLALGAYLLLCGFEFRTAALAAQAPPAVWIAGVLGAIYVSAIIILAPKLGTALTFSLIVLGQMGASLVLDHFGLFGLPVKTINWQRVVGTVSLILGVVLIRRY
jgi:bacterial/archaeal transporter family-2 protein